MHPCSERRRFPRGLQLAHLLRLTELTLRNYEHHGLLLEDRTIQVIFL